MATNLKFQRKDGIATIQLDRPQKKNSLNADLRHELEACMAELAHDREVKVVILTGGEEVFCAGADISEIEGTSTGEAAQ